MLRMPRFSFRQYQPYGASAGAKIRLPMLCLFEDRTTDNFYPLVLNRHVADLLVGAATLRARAVALLGREGLVLHGRRYIRDYYGARGFNVDRPGSGLLCVNGRALLDRDLIAKLPSDERWQATSGDTVVAARLASEDAARLNWDDDALDFTTLDLPEHELPGAHLYGYLWDLLADNGSRIASDFAALYAPGPDNSSSGVHIVKPEATSIHPDAVIKPGVVIDASDGPVVIGAGTTVMANSVVQGPCFIGPGCTIKIGAKIYEGSSFGARCKIGGEVENSIVIGYANKQHDGFLGHSYLGAWVNLGADTNTSDLKNNYGPVRVRLNGRDVESGRMLLGSLIGDHSKTGINTMLNTGTVIGFGANVFGGGFPPKEIPSFAWGGTDGFDRFRLEQAIELARTVSGRRDVEFTDADVALMRAVWDLTQDSSPEDAAHA